MPKQKEVERWLARYENPMKDVVVRIRELVLAADHVIDLGPGPAARGGQIVVSGTPREVAGCIESATGRVLAECYARETNTA